MIDDQQLLQAIPLRHSVRHYNDSPLTDDVVAALREEIARCNSEGALHIQLVLDERRAFAGPLAYGKFTGVNSYLVMAGEKEDALDEKVGYYGERLVLAAQVLGLNTCWAALSYRRVKGVYHVADSEKLVCKIALGYGTTQGAQHKSKTVEQASNISDSTPAWFRQGVEAALLAPTAVNQQKFSFEYVGSNDKGIGLVRAHHGFSPVGFTHIDLGVAKLHFELAAGREHFLWT